MRSKLKVGDKIETYLGAVGIYLGGMRIELVLSECDKSIRRNKEYSNGYEYHIGGTGNILRIITTKTLDEQYADSF